tara:strand:+ start:1023 stop:1190 length:168 start_codon:yes stop_codon:yes gene_type:complete
LKPADEPNTQAQAPDSQSDKVALILEVQRPLLNKEVNSGEGLADEKEDGEEKEEW